jgi:hypothetical protein
MLAWWIGGVIVVLLVGIGLYCFWPRQSSVVGVAPTPVTANAEIEALKAKIKAMEAPRAKVVEEGAHPVQQYGVKTFNPTTVLGETNSRNVPTIVRTERHVAPNGVFYLLFGIDPILKKERMVTAGGATVTLLEPEWKCKRPKGELQLLENPPKGLEIPMGRYIVAVVE